MQVGGSWSKLPTVEEPSPKHVDVALPANSKPVMQEYEQTLP